MATGNSDLMKWLSVFNKDKAKDDGKDDFGDVDIPDIDEVLGTGDAPKKGKVKKKLSVERIYQKKTQLEHILLRPDTYIGSIEKVTQAMWVYDADEEMMVQREITYVPGLYKIFDEILVNASDNKQRDPRMSAIKIDIDPETNRIKIWNNGKGIPIVEHQVEKVYVPTLIFGHLLTSSNYDDTEKKVTGGRNGYGAKLCNIFSEKFVVETQCNEYKKSFKQTWSGNMSKASEPKISSAKGEDFTCITFQPDLSKFGMEKLDRDIVDLFTRRAYDIIAASRGVKVFLNGKKINIKNFREYINLYIKNKNDDSGQALKVVHESVNDRWEVAVTLSEKGYQQVSFANSIATTKGGRHVDYVSDQVVAKLIETVKKKQLKKETIAIKPFQVRSHLWIFVNCLIENPTFDSQTKENMTLLPKNFGSKCQLSEKFVGQVAKCGIVESIMSWMKFKAQEKLNSKCGAKKSSKLKGVPKLDDANNAGTKFSMDCTLILTEGDSAKSLAVAGLGIVGRDKYGVFPLRGKVLNVREASHKQIMENAEINNMIKILGLRYKEKYDTFDSLKTLRYGKMMIMTDQDQDGSHIKGLLINFIHHNWPNLLKQNFLEEFITPIVKVTKNKAEKAFFSLPEFEEWKNETDNWHTWKIKYYKGLGTSTAKEAKEYFSDMQRHRIPFRYNGTEDDASIILAFSRKKIEDRKDWLTNWMEERKRRAELGLPELYLYGKETRKITYTEFVNRELILFSNMDNERSIPSMMDGLKPGQRKVLFTCFKRNLIKEMKVAQLAGSVGEHSAYHHGEASLMATIINLAQNFVGSNNINLLQPIGQFGTRLHGGKDAASPRYIFTLLSVVSKLLINAKDTPLLKNLFDDNLRIEPEYYAPIIPLVLVNGADGIGTGWSTKIPNYNPREITRNIFRLLDGEELELMSPWFKDFKGTIERLEDQRYVVNGEVSILDDQTIEITELPVRTWTQTYKENVLEPMLQGTDKTPPSILDYKEYHTDTTVKFIVKMTPDKLAQAEMEGLHKAFKLQTSLSTSSMVLFDSQGVMKRYADAEDIMREFFDVRMEFYHKRKVYMEGMLAAESLQLDNKARFICEKIDGIIVIENVAKKQTIQILVKRGYDSDPVKRWKQEREKIEGTPNGIGKSMSGNPDSDDESDNEDKSGPDFNYILGMPLWNLTKEKKEELVGQRDAKRDELSTLQKKSPSDLWRFDLDEFMAELDNVEEQEKRDAESHLNQVKGKMAAKGKRKIAIHETKPSPIGRRVEPRIDAAQKARVAAAASRKRKAQEKKDKVITGELFDDDDEIKPLAERIGKPAEKKAKKEKKEVQWMSTTDASPKKKKGKQKKHNPWSDSEDEDLSINGESDLDLEPTVDIAPRVTTPRRTAAAKVKYNYSSGSGSGSDSGDLLPVATKTARTAPAIPISDSEGSDFDFNPKKSSASTRALADSDSDIDQDRRTNTESSQKDTQSSIFARDENTQSTVSKGTLNSRSSPSPERNQAFDDSDSDLEELHVEPAPPPKKTTLKLKVNNEVVTRTFSDSDSSFGLPEPEPEKPKKKAAPKKPRAKKDPNAESKKTTTGKKRKDKGSGDEKPKKKGRKKAAKKFSDSDDEWDVSPVKKKAPAKRKKKGSDLSDNDMDEEFVAYAPRAPTDRRQKAPVKYNFGDNSDDDDDGDDDDDFC